jgi:hypothetical protein
MNQRINFEDNIFALYLRLRTIRDLFVLDAERELFLEKTLEDLEFIGRILEILLKNLEDPPHLFDRGRYFESLSEVEWQYTRLLTSFLNNSGSLTVENHPSIRGKLALLREKSDERRGHIDHSIFSGEKVLAEPVVSGVELSELLKDLG